MGPSHIVKTRLDQKNPAGYFNLPFTEANVNNTKTFMIVCFNIMQYNTVTTTASVSLDYQPKCISAMTY